MPVEYDAVGDLVGRACVEPFVVIDYLVHGPRLAPDGRRTRDSVSQIEHHAVELT